MNLALTQEQALLRDTCAKLFATESSPERVRLAEQSGFDAELWRGLAGTGALGMRVPEKHGGYGLSLEYDIQLYYQRAKAIPLLAGDPNDELLRVADRLWNGARVSLPDVGAVPLDFELGEAAEAFRGKVRAFFEANLTDELRAIPNVEYYAPWFREPIVPGISYDDWRQLSDHARHLTRYCVADSSEELPAGFRLGRTPPRRAPVHDG